MEPIKDIKQITLKICPGCKAVIYRNKRYSKEQFLQAFCRILGENVVLGNENAKILCNEDDSRQILSKKKKDCLIIADDGENQAEYLVPLNVSSEQCMTCCRKSGKYYEGILQIRNKKNPRYQEIVALVRNAAKKELEKGVFVQNEIELKDGTDFQLSSKKFIKNMAQQIYNDFGGELKINAQLFSRNHQTGKDVFRVNAIVKLPDYDAGDVIIIDNEPVMLKKIIKNEAIGYNYNKDKQVRLVVPDKPQVISKGSFQEAVVSKRRPDVEVIHPETYQSVRVEGKSPVKKDKALVFVYGDKVYLV